MDDTVKFKQSARRAWYIRHGICPVCGQNDALPGRQKCAACTEKSTLNNIKYRSLEKERTYYQKKKLKRQERIAAGLCPRCGKPAIKGQLCLDHYVKKQHIHEMEKREREIKGDPRRERVKNGKCWFCNNTALPGKKVCQIHYDVLSNRPGFSARGGESHPWRAEEKNRISEIRKKYKNNTSTT
jgi:hypothetical protein